MINKYNYTISFNATTDMNFTVYKNNVAIKISDKKYTLMSDAQEAANKMIYRLESGEIKESDFIQKEKPEPKKRKTKRQESSKKWWPD